MINKIKLLSTITPVISGYMLLTNRRGQQSVVLNLSSGRETVINSTISFVNGRSSMDATIRQKGIYRLNGGIQGVEFQEVLKFHDLSLSDFAETPLRDGQKPNPRKKSFTCKKPTLSNFFRFTGREVINQATGQAYPNFSEVEVNPDHVAQSEQSSLETPTLAWGKKELLAYAQAKGVEVKSTSTKPQILEALKAHS